METGKRVAGPSSREHQKKVIYSLKAHFYVMVVEAHRGGFTPGTPVRFDTLEGACETCKALQSDFDLDCEPKRVYVLDSFGVPIFAAGGRASKPDRV